MLVRVRNGYENVGDTANTDAIVRCPLWVFQMKWVSISYSGFSADSFGVSIDTDHVGL